MVFSSASFLFLFLPVIFILYRLVPGIKGKNFLLLAASLLFYTFGEPVYVLLLLFSVLLNYLSGRLLARTKKSGRMVLTCAVLGNLVLLAFFKYADFVVETINSILGTALSLPGIALPVGISFFTFQGLSYVVDVYRDRAAVSRSFVKLALYISFFPQLIAGPIVKYHDVSRQIDNRETTLTLTADGLRRFVIGLAKKLLIANTVGQMADLVFSASPAAMDIRSAWLGALAYMLQIYFDFSGYSDMAIGLGKMFGFHFLENFQNPYASRSIKEFWRRWHISLSTWFRDYLYIPLGGNRKGKLRTELNKIIVFFCTGLWHGASWSFVLWGLWHGFFLILEDYLPRKKSGRTASLLRWLGTVLIVLLGFVLFRAESLFEAQAIWVKMFTGFSFNPQSRFLFYQLTSPYRCFTLLLGCVCAMPLLPRVKTGVEHCGEILRHTLEALSYVFAFFLFVLCVLNLAGSEFNPFIYFRF